MGGTACKQYFILVAIFIFRDSPERTRPALGITGNTDIFYVDSVMEQAVRMIILP